MEQSKPNLQRCAIYTRKSSEEGLEQEFNSLHAQREACEAFIKSQTGEGWRLIKTAYDDGGPLGRDDGASCPSAPVGRYPTETHRRRGRLQSRSPDPLTRRLRQDGRTVRRARRFVRS